MTTSKCGSATGHLLDQDVIGLCAFEAHLRLAACADGGGEVPVHRLVTADVPPRGPHQPGYGAVGADQDGRAVGLEGDHAAAAVELRDAKATQQRGDLAGVEQRPDRTVVVVEGDELAPTATVAPARGRGLCGRRCRAVAADPDDPRAETAGEVQPVHPLLEEGVTSGERLVVAP